MGFERRFVGIHAVEQERLGVGLVGEPARHHARADGVGIDAAAVVRARAGRPLLGAAVGPPLALDEAAEAARKNEPVLRTKS